MEILSGIRNGETLGSLITLCIFNRDYENGKSCMAAELCDESAIAAKKLTKGRSGHADLVGALKYEQEAARNVLERAFARETAIRVTAGEIFKQYLEALGIEISGYVYEVCGIKDGGRYATNSE